MREILVSGSTAYDMYMHFEGNFSKEFEVQGHNMSLISQKYEKNHGGTGANIAYNLALLGENPVLLTSVGMDYSFDGIMQEKVNLDYIHKDSRLHTAQSIIISDSSDNRLTFFHPGAMNAASETKISYVQEEITVAIVSANDPQTMIEHAKNLSEEGVKILADPAQQISTLTEDALKEFLGYTDFLIVNQFEYDELREKIGIEWESIKYRFEWIIVTKGDKGVTMHQNSTSEDISTIHIEKEDIIDTTGAGDALRAGILLSLAEGYDIRTGCKLGNILASYCIQAPGSQYHHFNIGQLIEDMKTHYDIEIDLYQKRKY